MECKYWEEKGLLITSGELNEEEAKAFKDHCLGCEACKREFTLYQQAKDSFFQPHMFEESPSAAVDNEILRVCSQPIRPTMVSTLFSGLIKNSIYALLIFFVGFGGGAYFIAMKTDSDALKTNVVQQQVVTEQQKRMAAHADSAASDSASHHFNRGSSEDIVPVGVQGK